MPKFVIERAIPGVGATNAAGLQAISQKSCSVLQEMGVNRVSLGVQSFDDACLKTLERRHTASQAIAAIERCREASFENLSIDLIFGVPGQDIAAWRQSLNVVSQLPLQHVSTYGLTYEQGTPFFRRAANGQLSRMPYEQERTMYLLAIDHLQECGFEHYEVSNFARPGFSCRHNQTYWKADEYEGFGPGAARYVNGVRTTNCRSVTRWIRSWLKQEGCLHETETLNAEDKAREAMMLALRMTRGLDVDQFRNRFGMTVESLAGEAIRRHEKSGLLAYDPPCLRLTREGLLLADTVVSDFL